MSIQHPIVVICAMESEAIHLRRRLMDAREEPFYQWHRAVGQIGGADIQIVIGGIGLINSAAVTSVICHELHPRSIFNYGCAGAHRSELDCGDVIIGERIVHLSSVVITPDGNERYSGFRYMVDGEEVLTDYLYSNSQLVEVALANADAVALPAWPGIDHPPRIVAGAVGSADIWNQYDEYIAAHHFKHGTLCEDMEAAAIAQVCAMDGIPFLAVKDISNNELQEASNLSEDIVLGHLESELGLRASMIVEAVIQATYGS